MEEKPLAVYEELESVLDHNQPLILDQTARLKKLKYFLTACNRKRNKTKNFYPR